MIGGCLRGSRADDDGDAKAGASSLQVAQRGDRLRVRPLQVVEHQDKRRVIGEHGDECLEHLHLFELPVRSGEPELGQDRAERGQPLGVELSRPSSASRNAVARGT